jgi:hypothetical protein
MYTAGTSSSVAWELQNSETGRHEPNRTGQRKDVADDFQLLKKAAEKK